MRDQHKEASHIAEVTGKRPKNHGERGRADLTMNLILFVLSLSIANAAADDENLVRRFRLRRPRGKEFSYSLQEIEIVNLK